MPVHYLAWYKTMKSYGIHFSEDHFYKLGGMPSHKIVEVLALEQAVNIDATKAAREKEDAFMERLAFLEPIAQVLEVVQDYRGRIPLAVASGGFRDIILKQLQHIGCSGWFDAVVTAEDTARHKPFPDVFLEAARRMGVSPQACLVYEDSDLGIEAAQAAHMDFVDVRSFYSPRRIPID
jgi:HAD superfamily hydrolase (TIGR01509 family)